MSSVSGPTEAVPDTGVFPFQAPEAVQVLTLVLDHASVEEPPDATLEGDAFSVTVGLTAGALVTVTATLRVMELLAFEQWRMKVLVAFRGPVGAEPTFGREPDQAPDASQLCTFFADHLS